MRVVQVTFAFDPSIETPSALLDGYRTLTDWNEAIAATGASVTSVQAFHTDAALSRNGVAYVFRRGADRWRRTQAVAAAVARLEPDLVHVNGLDAVVDAWWLRRGLPLQTAMVVQDHGGAPPPRQSWRGRARRVAMRAADAFLFTSVEQGLVWVRAGAIRAPELVHAVPEAGSRFEPMARDRARLRSGVDGAPALLWVGRLDANKDPMTVLDGFERFASRQPPAKLTMVYQGGSLLADVRGRIEASDVLASRVRLAGQVPHDSLPAWYRAADLFVLGSHYESCGYALIEACACGCVPVVTDIAPFQALTGGGRIGVHWGVGDSGALVEALSAAAALDFDVEWRRVREHFDDHLIWDAVGRRARAIYDAVIEGRRAAVG